MSDVKVTPTEADREAAANWHREQGNWHVDWYAMRRGEMDDSGTVQAFARRHLAGLTPSTPESDHG